MPNFNFPAPFDPDLLAQILRSHPAFSNPLVPMTIAALTLNPEQHDGRTMLFDRLAGVAVTLPKATGSGAKYLFKIKTAPTSGSLVVKVGNTVDIIQGGVHFVDTDTAGTTTAFQTAGDSDTITLSRTTTGGVSVGEWLELEDIASGVYAVRGVLSNTASGATPFTAGI